MNVKVPPIAGLAVDPGVAAVEVGKDSPRREAAVLRRDPDSHLADNLRSDSPFLLAYPRRQIPNEGRGQKTHVFTGGR